MKKVNTPTRERLFDFVKSLPSKELGGAALALLLAAGCSSGTEKDSDAAQHGAATAISTTPSPNASASPNPTTSELPMPPAGRKVLPEVDCSFGAPVGRHQRPFRDSAGRMIVMVDGRCNPPADAPVGFYDGTAQEGRAPAKADNGEQVIVECRTTGEPIQDGRGPASTSTTWVRAVLANESTGQQPRQFYVPAVNLGQLDSTNVPPCPGM